MFQYSIRSGHYRKFKVKFLSFKHVCVICSSIMNKQIAKPALYKTIKEIELNITANTSHTLHCLLEYRNRYRPSELRHCSTGSYNRNSRDKSLLSHCG